MNFTTPSSAKRSPFLQTKLKIGQPNDLYEKEADKVADHVLKMRESQGAPIQRKCADCEGDLQMKPSSSPVGPVVPQTTQSSSKETSSGVSKSLLQRESSGQKMDRPTELFMSRSIGADFSDVKIHTDSNAAQMNRQLNARAFTHGKDIYFNQGEYKPDSAGGKHLLAHELTHVLQQETLHNRIQCYPGPATLPKALERRVDRGIKKMKKSKRSYLVAIAEALTTGVYDIAVPEFFDTSSFSGSADACPISKLKPISFSEATNRKQRWEQGDTGWETRNWIARVPGTNTLLPVKKGVDAYTRQFGSYDGVIYLYRNPRLEFLDLIIHEAIHLNNPLKIMPGDPGSYREKFLSELRSYYYGDYRNVWPEDFRFRKAVMDAENETAYLTGEGISIDAAVFQRETWKREMGSP